MLSLFKKFLAGMLIVLGGLSIKSCSDKPSTEDQIFTMQEITERGFLNPRYAGVHNGKPIYLADLGDCRLSLVEDDGSIDWLVESGNTRVFDYWVKGDDQVNAVWLRYYPTGTTVKSESDKSSKESVNYNLEPGFG